jgi:preprotein translocase subunit SecA
LALKYLMLAPRLKEDRFVQRDDVAAVLRRAGRHSFQRKLATLSDYGAALDVPALGEQVLSQVMLRVIDEKWKDHLYDLDQLRNAITYRAWGQKDPLIEYKKDAFEMFVDLMADLRGTFTDDFFKVQVTAAPPPPPAPPIRAAVFAGPTLDTVGEGWSAAEDEELLGAGVGGGTPRRIGRAQAGPVASGVRSPGWGGAGTVTVRPKVGRNDPCPCGSGKKYKKCHGANV